jgi:hypothetical protein
VGRLALLASLVCACASAAAGAPAPLTFAVFAKTTLPLGDVAWTGQSFLYVAERTGEIDAGVPGGSIAKLASLPAEYEEVRCAPSPGAHGWPAGAVYCHGPHGEVWRVGADGSVARFATLPDTKLQDGTLTFDTPGGFGYVLLAASGGSASKGGSVFSITPDGTVRRVGSYPGPGGADNLALAPAAFGSAANELLLAIDARSKGGRLLAMAPDGKTRELVHVAHGINPIAVIGDNWGARGTARPGFYVSDTLSKDVYVVSGPQLAQYAGAVLVGDEKGLARFWIVRPSGGAFTATRLATNLNRLHSSWNLEGATYVP